MAYNEEQDYVEDPLNVTSKINSAGLVNSTLSNLWQDFFRHYRHGQYLSANSDLDCVWTILGGEKGIEGSDTEKAYFNVESEIKNSGELRDSLRIKGFGKVDPADLQILVKQKALLLKKALFLRRLQNDQGKGTAYLDETEGDFD